MDAIYCNPHIRTLYFIYGHRNSFLREEGMRRDAFSVLLREKTSIKSVTIKSIQTELTPFGDILQDFMHLEHLTIEATWRRAFERNTIEMIIKLVNNLPRLSSVSFVNTVITHDDGIAIAQWLIGKRSMKGLQMVHCVVKSRAGSTIIDALKTDNDCTLRDVSLFVANEEWWAPNKDQEIRLCLIHNARVQSIKEFVMRVTTRDPGAGATKSEFEDIKGAVFKDHNDCDPSHPVNHLFSLLRAKPDYIKRCVENEKVYSMSNKRRKLKT
jgi:hypothetical protein